MEKRPSVALRLVARFVALNGFRTTLKTRVWLLWVVSRGNTTMRSIQPSTIWRRSLQSQFVFCYTAIYSSFIFLMHRRSGVRKLYTLNIWDFLNLVIGALSAGLDGVGLFWKGKLCVQGHVVLLISFFFLPLSPPLPLLFLAYKLYTTS